MTFSAKTFRELTTAEVYEILKSRAQIFLLEQNITCLDEDDVDYESLHCFFLEQGRVTAYLRAYRDSEDPEAVKIGRVLTLEHGKGIGTELMKKSLPVIIHHFQCRRIWMDAQKHAEEFYRELGFVTISDEYLEEGVVHVDMEMIL